MTAKRIIQSYWSEPVALAPTDFADYGLSDDQRSRLLSAMNSYRESIDGHRAAARPGKVRPILAKLSKSIEDLDQALAQLSRQNRAALMQMQKSALKIQRTHFGDRNVKELRATLNTCKILAEDAISTLPADAGGAGDDPYLNRLIASAISIYSERGDFSKYGNRCLSFCDAVCRKVGHKFSERRALIKRIQLLELTTSRSVT